MQTAVHFSALEGSCLPFVTGGGGTVSDEISTDFFFSPEQPDSTPKNKPASKSNP
jgi:hypothetical protein